MSSKWHIRRRSERFLFGRCERWRYRLCHEKWLVSIGSHDCYFPARDLDLAFYPFCRLFCRLFFHLSFHLFQLCSLPFGISWFRIFEALLYNFGNSFSISFSRVKLGMSLNLNDCKTLVGLGRFCGDCWQSCSKLAYRGFRGCWSRISLSFLGQTISSWDIPVLSFIISNPSNDIIN